MQELFDDTMRGEELLERDDIVIDRWIDRARVGAIAYMGLCGLAGVIFILIDLSSGQYIGALVALVITLATCGLGVAALLGVRIGRIIHANTKRLDKLNYRIDQLEAAFDAQELDLQLVSPQPRDPSELVGASLSADRYPRLVAEREEVAAAAEESAAHKGASQDRPAPAEVSGATETPTAGEEPFQKCNRLWGQLKDALQDKQIESWRKRLDQLNRDHARSLRERFRVILGGRDYREALDIGRQIVDLYPGTRMADDFRAIESRIEELAFGNNNRRAESRL